MDSSFLLTIFAAAGVLIYTLLRILRFLQDTEEKVSSSSSPSSFLTPSLVPPSSSSVIWTHHVFPSFRGEDVRRDFLSHILAEFQRMGITPFIDNEIKRGESIGPELIRAIQESKIAVILLSKNYASSKWCLDELVEIMKCREELGQSVLAIFYKVDPSDLTKLTGDFGKVFRKTCIGKPKEDIARWKQALQKVATVAGYHSSNWDNEAAMIKKIVIDISNKLNSYASSSDFDGLVGMRAHLEKMEPLLCLDSDEVRMIGIWGPPGIGKTTIARVAYDQHSNSFQLCVFMENIKANHTRPCSDEYSAKLQLQQKLMSQITDHKGMKIPHLGVIQDRLKDKKVLVVLDGVDHLMQLDAMAKETWWFGPGSRILVTAQDQKLFKSHDIKHIYKVNFPSTDEALQIFCMSVFGQKSSKEGFEELARKVTELVGKLPLALRVMGSYFRGMIKQYWIESLPRLESSLNSDIQSILYFCYDALDDENKELFLHIACFFNHYKTKRVVEHLEKKFVDVRQRLNILADKSLISFGHTGPHVEMHSLLVKLGREIVRKQYIHDPGRRHFLVDKGEICEVLIGDAVGSKSVVGIDLSYILSPEHFVIDKEFDMSERAFEEMSNLQFLRLGGYKKNLPRGLNYISRKLQLLDWSHFPMSCLPSIVNLEFLVELIMRCSKLEKLWDGIKQLPNLKRMNLSGSVNLKEFPDISTATNLENLNLGNCSSLVELPPSIGNATNLKCLILHYCRSLVELPPSIGNAINLKYLILHRCLSLVELPTSIGNITNLQYLYLSGCSSLEGLPLSIGNATNLEKLDLSDCSSLVELPLSIGNLHKLKKLILEGCSKLEDLPTNINLKSLEDLDLTNCSMLKFFPEISTNVRVLKLGRTAIEEVPPSINSWSHLEVLCMSECKYLKGFYHTSESITKIYLGDKETREVPPFYSVRELRAIRNFVKEYWSWCVDLDEHPGFTTTPNLQNLYLWDCSNSKKLFSTIWNAINQERSKMSLSSTEIQKVPPMSTIWNAINLERSQMYLSNTEIEEVSSISSFRKLGPLQNLGDMDLSWCENLKELPNFSTATNLYILNMWGCSNLRELPSTIGDAINLEELDLRYCSNLVELPLSIGNLQKLTKLRLEGCSKLETLPENINLKSLDELNLTDCSMLKFFPDISTNVERLLLTKTAIEEVPFSIGSWPRLNKLHMSYYKNLKDFPHALEIITGLELSDTEIKEVPPCVKSMPHLHWFMIEGCKKLVSLPQFPDSLSGIDAEGCESLERLHCSFHNLMIRLNFAKCFKLNQEARDLIIHTRTHSGRYPYSVLPGREVPPYFTHRANCGDCSMTIKLNEIPLPKSVRFKACIWLVYKGDDDTDWKARGSLSVTYNKKVCLQEKVIIEHLYIFEVEAEVTSSELVFEFEVKDKDLWETGEFGLRQLS